MRAGLLLASSSRPAGGYGAIVYRGREGGSGVSANNVVAGIVDTDLVLATHFDTEAVAAFVAPFTNQSASGFSRCASFVRSGEVFVEYPQPLYPILSGWGNAQFRSATFASGTGQTVSFPAAQVFRTNSVIVLAGFRVDAGGTGDLTYSILGGTTFFGGGGVRQFGVYLVRNTNFSGADVTYANLSSDWYAMTVVLEPVA